MKSQVLTEIIERALFNQCTDLERLDDILSKRKIVAYVGFDATADSLHIGHLVSLMAMRVLVSHGHTVIALLGGATSKVGDPSFRSSARPMLTDEAISHNVAGIQRNIETVLGGPSDKVIFVNNESWLGERGFLEFMRNVGAHFSIARMLTMDSVKSRLNDNNPLSMLEFSYMMLQATDFAELAKSHNCELQLGGSDQWGNIVNGIDLARRMDGKELLGLTTPLLTTGSGQKMGKTANGAIWLSNERLAPFAFWQFWRNVEDRDVSRFLKLFSTMSVNDIYEITAQSSDINLAKIALANAVTSLVHGADMARSCEDQARALFTEGSMSPTHFLPKQEAPMTLPDVIVSIGFAPSKSEARRLIEAGAVKVNGEKETNVTTEISPVVEHLSLSVGKRQKAVVAFQGND